MKAGARVLVAVTDISWSDRIVTELLKLGLDPTPAFSPVEAIDALDGGGFEGLIVEDGADDASEALRRWLRRRFKGVVISVHLGEEETQDEEFAANVAGALWKSGMTG